MSPALRSILAACSIVGGCTAVFTVATLHPVDRGDTPLHTTAASATSPRRSIRRSYLSVPRHLLSGLGSWYGDMFDGRATASGEIFDKDALTACHPTLPFGTLVRVINLRNRRSVIVRINDRGLRPDRVIDLSSAAAEKIGMLETGVAPVRIEILARQRS